MKKLITSALILCCSLASPSTWSHGEINGGHCFNDWHLSAGKCHKPHSHNTNDEAKHFIKNGGHCYNGWYLDRKSGKCKESLGWFQSENDTL
jgi:hypothetical protein